MKHWHCRQFFLNNRKTHIQCRWSRWMWQTDEIQDNIRLYLEGASSSWKVTPVSWRAAIAESADATSQQWADCAFGRILLFIITVHRESGQYTSELLIWGFCQYSSMWAGSNAITKHQAAGTNTHADFQPRLSLKTLLLQIQHTDDAINYLSVQISLRLLLLWHNEHTFSPESCRNWHFSLSDSSRGGFLFFAAPVTKLLFSEKKTTIELVELERWIHFLLKQFSCGML